MNRASVNRILVRSAFKHRLKRQCITFLPVLQIVLLFPKCGSIRPQPAAEDLEPFLVLQEKVKMDVVDRLICVTFYVYIFVQVKRIVCDLYPGFTTKRDSTCNSEVKFTNNRTLLY